MDDELTKGEVEEKKEDEPKLESDEEKMHVAEEALHEVEDAFLPPPPDSKPEDAAEETQKIDMPAFMEKVKEQAEEVVIGPFSSPPITPVIVAEATPVEGVVEETEKAFEVYEVEVKPVIKKPRKKIARKTTKKKKAKAKKKPAKRKASAKKKPKKKTKASRKRSKAKA